MNPLATIWRLTLLTLVLGGVYFFFFSTSETGQGLNQSLSSAIEQVPVLKGSPLADKLVADLGSIKGEATTSALKTTMDDLTNQVKDLPRDQAVAITENLCNQLIQSLKSE